MRTRERIIATARRLYNERGYANVTTAALAQACGIAEGNLWYHFKTRNDLLQAITGEFSRDIEARLAVQPDPDDPIASYAGWLHELMREQRKYRFLYRDSPHLGEHVEVMVQNVPDWLARSQDCIALHLRAMAKRGLLDWPANRLDGLAANATIVLRYGLEYFEELGEPQGAVRKTLLQHLTLFEHRLNKDAARALRTAVERIGKEVKVAA